MKMAVHITAYLDGKTVGIGYRFIVTKGYTSWRAYQTVAGLKYFLKNFGLEIDASRTEYIDSRHLGNGRWVNMTCKEKKVDDDFRGFWDISEVPQGAKPYYDLCNGSYVQCYILDKGDEVITYKPNPNAKEVYKPLDYSAFRKLIG
jgi:hypothetical protein